MKQEVFENKSVWKAIFTMTIPALITILVMIFYNMADMLFIGQLGIYLFPPGGLETPKGNETL